MKKLAVVTGGTRGIGSSICKVLLENGYEVAANYARNEEAAKKFTEETGIRSYKWDVSDYSSCEKGIKSIIEDFGYSPQILINNAGVTADAMLHKTTPDNWNKVVSTNLTSCFNMCHVVIGEMRNQGYGRIINISSVNAQTGQMGQTNYSAAKAGMLGFTKALARESAFKGITVNAVAPGYTNTEMVAAAPKAFIDKIVENIPVGRLGKPEEISNAVLFLISDNAAFITGETLSVNGGSNME